MKKSEIANWLFYYYLIGTVSMGLILIIIGPENSLLSLTDNLGVFAIIIPVFLGQVTILYQWFTNQAQKEQIELSKNLNISKNLVKLPPIIVLSIFGLAIILRGFGRINDWEIQIDESQFKALVTFGMSILNVTSIYLVSLFYRSAEEIIEKE